MNPPRPSTHFPSVTMTRTKKAAKKSKKSKGQKKPIETGKAVPKMKPGFLHDTKSEAVGCSGGTKKKGSKGETASSRTLD